MEIKPGKLLDEKWEIHDKIGRGTFGSVYKGRHKKTCEKIAVKKIKTPLTDDGIPIDTLREIVVLRSISHDNIVKYINKIIL
jgi:serine/threonine protein kinase